MLGFDLLSLAGNGEPLNHIVEFSDVAGPMMLLQQGECRRSDAGDTAAMFPTGLCQEVVENWFDVVEPFPERGDTELIHIEPVVEVEPEAPGLDMSRKVFVRCGDDSDVHLVAVRISERVDGVIFEDPQQFGLCRRAHLADFIKEQRAAFGELEPSWFRVFGVGESALMIAKEF